MTRVKRTALLAAIAILTMNIWTGSPLLAVWVGSRFQQHGPPTMGAFAIVAITLLATSIVLVRLVARLEGAYDRVSGRRRGAREQLPWLKSMRAGRLHDGETLRAVDGVVIGSVVLAAIAFEAWFFFFAGSSIGT
jgi:hypothetical protein